MAIDISKVDVSTVDLKRGLVIPKEYNSKLAEFLGIMAGDGYMNYYPRKHEYRIEIAGHVEDDYEYLTNYVSFLFNYLFKIEPKVLKRKDQRTLYLRVLSKRLVLFLKELTFPMGIKGEIKIPLWILKDNEYMVSFLRGLFDTDGYFRLSIRNGKSYYPTIRLKSKSESLIKEVNSWLIENGFKTHYSLSRVYYDSRSGKEFFISYIELNGHNNLDHFIDIIGSKNNKHLVKYDKIQRARRDSNPRHPG